MQKVIATLPEFTLIGISARTNNQEELTENGKIAPSLQRYFGEKLFDKILSLLVFLHQL